MSTTFSPFARRLGIPPPKLSLAGCTGKTSFTARGDKKADRTGLETQLLLRSIIIINWTNGTGKNGTGSQLFQLFRPYETQSRALCYLSAQRGDVRACAEVFNQVEVSPSRP